MPSPHLSQWKEAPPLIFISGQLAFDPNGRISHPHVAEQTTQVLRNLEAIVAKAGLKLQDIIKTTVWLRHEADFAAFNESYANYFGAVRPARSTVICALAHPDAVVEIEAIAYRPAA
ncbi:MAG TPA: RidA family protein [Steroidobacteraceae bacterium]|jgi:2-iminobutanoate/2-iminopropanoate deaminase